MPWGYWVLATAIVFFGWLAFGWWLECRQESAGRHRTTEDVDTKRLPIPTGGPK